MKLVRFNHDHKNREVKDSVTFQQSLSEGIDESVRIEPLNHRKFDIERCLFTPNGSKVTDKTVEDTWQKAIETAIQWVNE